jgi:hypothetical protein
VALHGCPEACGSVTVPYPFGFRQGCFHAGFNLSCDETHHPPKLFLGDGVEVDDISLAGGTVRVQSKIVTFPWSDPSGLWHGGLTGTGMQLAVSTEHNVFVSIGCNFIAYLATNLDIAGGGGHYRKEFVPTARSYADGQISGPSA